MKHCILHVMVPHQKLIGVPFKQISASSTKLTSLHPYHTRINQRRIMDRLEQNQADLRKDMDIMGERMTQLLETLNVVVQGQEELRQSVAKLINDAPTTVANGGSKPVPVGVPNNGDSHHKNDSELETFKFPIEENEKKFHLLEERLNALEGRSSSGLNAIDLCLVPDIKIPAKFKVPSFEKYKGITCPMSHIKAFCNKMAPYAENDKLLMHFFQDSLSGASLEWYTRLERTHVRTWDELAEAFLKHYKYNSDMAPTRLQLQSLTQKVDESFKEYAQRWRELASRVQPPLLERELVDMFMNTLKDPYLKMMIGCASSEFSNLVVVGERIENALRMGKVQDIANVYEFTEKEKSETDATSENGEEELPAYPQVHVLNYHQNYQQQGPRRPRRPPRKIDPIPMTYSQLLSHLINESLVELREAKPPPTSIPQGYDLNAKCEYHSGASGHSTEDCNILKHKVQDLIDSKAISFTPNGLHIN